MADRFDLDAIDADDALLDLLAAGGESARTAGEHDPAVKLLADLRLAVEVEDELPTETIDDPESFLARCAALNPVTDPFARKVATRGLALGVAAVAALSVSGVAAAVTGDPLSPYEKVIEKMVDAVRPQTSFPTEQLDGMPVVDKTKIVKVSKDYHEKQKEKERQAEQEKAEKLEPIPPASVVQQALPEVLQRVVLPEVEKQTVTKVAPPPADPTQAPTDETPTDNPTTAPTDEPTTTPSDEPTADPTTPTTEPTTEPTAPTDPATTPPPTEPSGDPTTTPPPNKGETGSEPGTNPSTDPTGTPTVPSGDQGSETETGSDAPADDQAPVGETDPAGDTEPAGDANPAGDAKPTEDQSTPADQQEPAENKPVELPLTELLDEVLPTPTGAPVESPGVQEFFANAKSAAKHSSGKVTTGSVKKTYAKGKHSSGRYAEGRHAAIARAHGSTESSDVLKILGVVNKPTN